MTEYLIDFLTPRMPINHYTPYQTNQYGFKIDNNGNVTIQYEGYYCGVIIQTIDIHDNVPIPLYLIDILKMLLKTEDENNHNYRVYCDYYMHIIAVIKRLKKKLAELVNNPENKEDLQLQLKFMFKKEELNKIEFNEIEQKHIKSIKNIQKYNEKLKEENYKMREEKKHLDMLREMYNRDIKAESEVWVERDKLRKQIQDLKKENSELHKLRQENVELQKLREDNHKLLKENYNLYKDLDNFRNKNK